MWGWGAGQVGWLTQSQQLGHVVVDVCGDVRGPPGQSGDGHMQHDSWRRREANRKSALGTRCASLSPGNPAEGPSDEEGERRLISTLKDYVLKQSNVALVIYTLRFD